MSSVVLHQEPIMHFLCFFLKQIKSFADFMAKMVGGGIRTHSCIMQAAFQQSLPVNFSADRQTQKDSDTERKASKKTLPEKLCQTSAKRPPLIEQRQVP
jgi:hypothetical protein